MELEDEVYEKVTSLCESGDSLVEESEYDKAINKYIEALNLIPDPKNMWEASTWIYTALGDTFFIKCDFKNAKEHLYNAVNCPDGVINPFILMRLGQCLVELGEIQKAKDYLLQAYMIEGNSIFEEEDEKYLNLIIDII